MFLGTHTRPVGLCNRIKASNFLTTRVVFDEGYITRDIYLTLFFSDLLLLFSHWCRAMTATIVDDVLDIAKERRVAVKDNLSAFGFVPFGIE